MPDSLKRTGEIRIRDPFVLADPDRACYFLYGTTGFGGAAAAWGFDVYRSVDLEHWEGPLPAFRPPPDFWATTQFWAPEVHRRRGRYYMFATFKAPGRYRGTQILAADRPEGPFLPLSSGPVTPPHWECLDGTFHLEEDGTPYLVFCHEWVQIANGAMCALPLLPDLTAAAGPPRLLFSAADAPWVRPCSGPAPGAGCPPFPNYITDGPWLHRGSTGRLFLLWSSTGPEGYAVGVAESSNGRLDGEWRHEPAPLFARDGGHAMIFRDLGGRLFLAMHAPNAAPDERARFFALGETGDGRLKLLDGTICH